MSESGVFSYIVDMSFKVTKKNNYTLIEVQSDKLDTSNASDLKAQLVVVNEGGEKEHCSRSIAMQVLRLFEPAGHPGCQPPLREGHWHLHHHGITARSGIHHPRLDAAYRFTDYQ